MYRLFAEYKEGESMSKISIMFLIFAITSSVVFFYSMGVIIFYEYSRYLHDLATFSLIGVVVSCVFGAAFDESKMSGKVKA